VSKRRFAPVLGPRLRKPTEERAETPTMSRAGEWAARTITGDFADQVGDRLEITGCELTDARLTACLMERARITDCVFRGCDLSGTILSAASLVRVEFVGCRLLGVTIPDGSFHDVKFSDCRMRMGNLRMAQGARVLFDHCDLGEADFYAARLESLSVFDCNLADVDFSQAKLPGARLHGSSLDGIKGASSLRGVVIDSSQVLPMALQMFGSMGVSVDDERDPDLR
jgi:uncharacterized protein YjbI with pentapeptide repeats